MAFKKFKISKDAVIALLSATTIFSTGMFLKTDDEFRNQVNVTNNTKAELSLNKKNNKTLVEKVSKIEGEKSQLQDKVKEMEKDIKSKDATIAELRQRIGDLQSKELPTKGVAISRGATSRGTPITLKLSFYGDGADENGGYAGMDAQSGKLRAGTVASNVYPFGTQFYINGQIFTVRDRGGSHFDSPDRIDVFVPRRNGETKEEYKRRIREYGRKEVKATKLS